MMLDNLQHLNQYAILTDDVDSLERYLIGLLALIWRIQGKRKKIINLDK